MEELIKDLILSIPLTSILACEFIVIKLGTSYKLYKNNNVNGKVINPAPKLETTLRIGTKEKQNNDIEEYLHKFISTLVQNIPKENIPIIKENLQSIKFRENFISKLKLLMGRAGTYYSIPHTIYISSYLSNTSNPKLQKQFIEVLSHELLHASTSFKKNFIYYVGFSQFFMQSNKIKKIGDGINEGYTDLLTKRFFNISEIKSDLGYKYERTIAKLIELIIGKEKMTKLYFNADLMGLINELAKYQNITKVKQFILDLDTINSQNGINFTGNDEKNLKIYNRINIFLYEAYSKKTDEQLKPDNITNYLETQKKFLELISETEKYTKFKGKKLVKRKTNGFISITSIITIITIISIGIAYLILKIS